MTFSMQKSSCLLLAAALGVITCGQVFAQETNFPKETSLSNLMLNHRLIASKTETFKEKEGFERKPKDIINTLKDNEVSGFSTMLDGLSQAYGLDKTLKDNGPFTFFAVSDADFKKLPGDDNDTLWANKKKLKQVLSYHIVSGVYYEKEALSKMTTVKTLEGTTDITVEKKRTAIFISTASCE